MSDVSNYPVNVQKNFPRKLKTLITRLVVIQGVGPEQSRKDRANAIRAWVFGNGPRPDLDLPIISEICGLLPNDVHANGLEYDINSRPEIYIPKYVALAQLYHHYSQKAFQPIPLATSLIPRHVAIDTRTLLHHILGIKNQVPINEDSKRRYWCQIFNLDHKVFRSRAGKQFNGFIRTDGVSLCVVLGPPSRQHGNGRKRIKLNRGNETPYVHQELIKPEYVVIDPNKRDLLYCLGSNDQKLRYTQPQRKKETRQLKYTRMRQSLGHHGRIYGHSNTTVDPAEFSHYLQSFMLDFEAREIHYRTLLYRKLKIHKHKVFEKV